uniref:Uncharacterized protein n=1 Tax=Zea mays TaxID=4577 RepID=B4FHG6_MAIZE|nr:unknown [Zea mays]
MADRGLARALVHHLQGSLQGSRVHEGGDGGAPLRLRCRRRLHRPRARVRAVEPGVQLHAGRVRPRAHLGGRRRQPREDGDGARGRGRPLPGPGVDAGPLHGGPPLRRQLHVGPRRGPLLLGPPAGVQRVQGEQLRARRPGGQERHARALAVAPQPGPPCRRRRQRRRRRGLHRQGARQVPRQDGQIVGLLIDPSLLATPTLVAAY